MKFTEQKIKGVFLIDAEPFFDDRGVFRRHFCQKEFSEHGIAHIIRQANISENKYAHTLRGFHYQKEPFGDAKTLSCIRGSIYDIVVDLRPASPTYMQWVAFEISSKKRNSIHIPVGCANAFLTMEDQSIMHYYHSGVYAPDYEGAVRYNDPVFRFEWPAQPEHISEKDRIITDFKPDF